MSLASVDNSILAVPERPETNGIACGGSEDIDIASKMADGEIKIDLLLELRYNSNRSYLIHFDFPPIFYEYTSYQKGEHDVSRV